MAFSNPNSHPDPPENFAGINLPTSTFKLKAYRLNPARHSSAIYFDRSGKGRFDAPDLGILYLGETIETAFIETFGRRLGQNYVSREFIKTRNLFKVESDSNLELVDLYGASLAKLGVDSELSSGRNYHLSRSWAKAIYHHPQQVAGIRYFSRHDNTQLCIGLFPRDSYNLSEINLGNLIDFDELKFYQILDKYEFGSD